MTTDVEARVPNIHDGISYWKTQPATLDGVLGGFGSGSLPRIDALGSRQFLFALLPELCTVPSAFRPPVHPDPGADPRHQRRLRALDAGAGIGRITSDVLLYLVSDVVLLEPVASFATTALAECTQAASRVVNVNDGEDRNRASTGYDAHGYSRAWPGLAEGRTSVTVVQTPLQYFDPAQPCTPADVLGRVGYVHAPDGQGNGGHDAEECGFDIIWCQWCLGHLADTELVAFLRASRCALALRGSRGVIVVKENLCAPGEDKGDDLGVGDPRSVFDPLDSSVTRSDSAFKKIFAEAGLRVVRERIQYGFPAGLYQVKMYALRAL